MTDQEQFNLLREHLREANRNGLLVEFVMDALIGMWAIPEDQDMAFDKALPQALNDAAREWDL